MEPDIIQFPQRSTPSRHDAADEDHDAVPAINLQLTAIEQLAQGVSTDGRPATRTSEELSIQDNQTTPPPAFLPPVWLLLLAVLPYWLIPAAHMVSSPETATGLFEYETPYYIANGRAIFERGNGFSYPNPYNPDPQHPAIYFHWLLWLLGFAVTWLKADPGMVWLLATCIGGIGFSMVTWRMVCARTLNSAQRKTLFLLACWGGGLLSLGGFLSGSFQSNDLATSLLHLDPGKGLWFLNWGRNTFLATEAVYHILAGACWIAEIRNRRSQSNLLMALLATTHPWSGLELLLTINVWRFFLVVSDRFGLTPAGRGLTNADQHNAMRVRRTSALISAGMLAAFLTYYKIWLPTFAHHEALQSVWKLNWSVSTTSACLAYCLVLIPATARILQAVQCGSRRLAASEQVTAHLQPNAGDRHDDGLFRPADWFLCCAIVVAAGLSFHDRFISPIQPIHFTRGYIWMPLFLLGLPVLQRWLSAASMWNWPGRFAVAGVLIIAVSDNLVFSAAMVQRQTQRVAGFRLDAEERVLMEYLHRKHAGQLLLCDSASLNYLLPAFANARPWLGHQFNTPDYEHRDTLRQQIFAGDAIDAAAIPDEIDVLIVHRLRDVTSLRHSSRWVQLRAPGADWQLWGQIVDAALPAGI